MNLNLQDIKTIHFEQELTKLLANEDLYNIAIVTSGYEKRSTYWAQKANEAGFLNQFSEWFAIGFSEKRDKLSRLANDSFYEGIGVAVTIIDDSSTSFKERITSCIEQARSKAGAKAICVHVDYSCMPRAWYCELPCLLQGALRRDENFCLWYSKGVYQSQEYPTAGVNDFNIFSGRPSLSAVNRTHLFGLGFDKIRSHAIWSVIDPQNVVCFFAANEENPEYLKKVRNDNASVIAASTFCFSAPIDDFVAGLSKIRSVVIDLLDSGDVIIVPDGPKPLILASSITPLTINRAGVVCFHVRRRRDEDIEIVDVSGSGAPTGLLLYGSPS